MNAHHSTRHHTSAHRPQTAHMRAPASTQPPNQAPSQPAIQTNKVSSVERSTDTQTGTQQPQHSIFHPHTKTVSQSVSQATTAIVVEGPYIYVHPYALAPCARQSLSADVWVRRRWRTQRTNRCSLLPLVLSAPLHTQISQTRNARLLEGKLPPDR